jgi:tetratricopeptide (TPR) repeat protein
LKLAFAAAIVLLTLAPSALADTEDDLDVIWQYFDRDMLRSGGALLDKLLLAEPDNAQALALKSEYCTLKENPVGAEAAARRTVEIDGTSAEYWQLWARAAFEQGRAASRAELPAATVTAWFQSAEVGFRKVRELDPDRPGALAGIGWCKEWLGAFDIAVQFFESEIREFPDHPEGYRRLAELSLTRADRAEDADAAGAARLREEAADIIATGLGAVGEDAELLFIHARGLLAAGNRRQAVEVLKRSFLADPSFEKSFQQLRTLVDPVKDLVPFAIEVLKVHPRASLPAWWAGFHTLRREPEKGEKPFTHYELTLQYVLPALRRNGDHEELYKLAFKAAQALVGATPKSAPNGKLAVKAFEQIHEAYVYSGDAANNLGFYFREVRKYRKSLDWYLLACERAPVNQDILNDTGLIYLFHFPKEKAKGLPYFEKTIGLVIDGDQLPERGYWDALENLCKHYLEVDLKPEKVIEYARLRYLVTKGVKPYNMSQLAAKHAKKAREILGK